MAHRAKLTPHATATPERTLKIPQNSLRNEQRGEQEEATTLDDDETDQSGGGEAFERAALTPPRGSDGGPAVGGRSRSRHVVRDHDCVQGVRYGCEGSDEPQWEEELVPTGTFAEMKKSGHRPPIPALLGLPLLILQRRSGQRSPPKETENESVTLLCVSPTSGFAPPRWQSRIGPCTVARADGNPFTVANAQQLEAYLDHLIDCWPTCPPSKHHLNPAGFCGFTHRTFGEDVAKALRQSLAPHENDAAALTPRQHHRTPPPEPRTPSPRPSSDGARLNTGAAAAGVDAGQAIPFHTPTSVVTRGPQVHASVSPRVNRGRGQLYDPASPAWQSTCAAFVAVGCAAGAAMWKSGR